MEKKKISVGVMNGSRSRTVPTRRKISTTVSAAGLTDTVMHLRNLGGNQAVQRLFESGLLRAKLTIGPANDIYEQEADDVANQVMRMPESSVGDQRSAVEEIQRKPG